MRALLEQKPIRCTQVCAGGTGHAEAVQVVFDPHGTVYEALLRQFFDYTDPTSLNAQGPDHGEQYRHGVYYHSKYQHDVLVEFIEKETHWRALGGHSEPIVTEVLPAAIFWPAEADHQNFAMRARDRVARRRAGLPALEEAADIYPPDDDGEGRRRLSEVGAEEAQEEGSSNRRLMDLELEKLMMDDMIEPEMRRIFNIDNSTSSIKEDEMNEFRVIRSFYNDLTPEDFATIFDDPRVKGIEYPAIQYPINELKSYSETWQRAAERGTLVCAACGVTRPLAATSDFGNNDRSDDRSDDRSGHIGDATASEDAAEQVWLASWQELIDEWWMRLPAQTAGSLQGCGMFLGGALASRLELWMHWRQRAAPPPAMSLGGCESLVEQLKDSIPDFPGPPAGMPFWMPPIPQLLPRQLMLADEPSKWRLDAKAPDATAAADGTLWMSIGALAGFAMGAALICGLRAPRHRRHRSVPKAGPRQCT